MTRKETEILLVMAENQGWASVDEMADDDWPSFRTLAERRFIVREGALNMAGYRLTEAGRVALEEVLDNHEQVSRQHADENAEKEIVAKRQERSALRVTALGAIVTGVVTLIVNNFHRIIAIVRSIFHN